MVRSPFGGRFPHEIKGEGIYAYVTLEGDGYSEAVKKDLVKTVREQIGAFAAPDVIHWAPGQHLPMHAGGAAGCIYRGAVFY